MFNDAMELWKKEFLLVEKLFDSPAVLCGISSASRGGTLGGFSRLELELNEMSLLIFSLDYNHQKEDGELGKKNPFITGEEKVKQAILESVLNSLPVWKKSLAFSATFGVARSSALAIQQVFGIKNEFIS